MPTCSGDWKSCEHGSQGSSCYIVCHYQGYCIYQLPNPGRPDFLEPKKEGDK